MTIFTLNFIQRYVLYSPRTTFIKVNIYYVGTLSIENRNK